MLFRSLNMKIFNSELKIFIFSDDNMFIKYLKNNIIYRDITVETFEDFNLLKNILITKFGYKEKILTNYANEDFRLFPDVILTHTELSTISLFVKKIMHVMSLSKNMVHKADIKDYGLLKIGLLSNEHVFLLKAIASRIGDIHDMELLMKAIITSNEFHDGNFDWKEI